MIYDKKLVHHKAQWTFQHDIGRHIFGYAKSEMAV